MTRNGIVCVEWTEPVDLGFFMREQRRRAAWTHTKEAVYLIEDRAGAVYVGTTLSVGGRLHEHLCRAAPLGRFIKAARSGDIVATLRWTEVSLTHRAALEIQVIFATRPRLNSISRRWHRSPLLAIAPDRRLAA